MRFLTAKVCQVKKLVNRVVFAGPRLVRRVAHGMAMDIGDVLCRAPLYHSEPEETKGKLNNDLPVAESAVNGKH